MIIAKLEYNELITVENGIIRKGNVIVSESALLSYVAMFPVDLTKEGRSYIDGLCVKVLQGQL
jgi:hypothetical protein